MDFALLFAPLAAADNPLPRQRRLYDLLRSAILDGVLAAGTRLPATRALATDLGIARNSVLYAYERLGAEGFLGADRHGTQVLAVARDTAAKRQPSAAAVSVRAQQLTRRRGFGGDGRAFAPGFPDCAAFPRRQWLSCLNAAWRRAGAAQLGYGAAAGEPALRQAIADYLLAARGVRCTAAQVLVTPGSQAGLDACARVLADAGAVAWVENPGYLGVRAAFRLADLRLHAVPVDSDGMAPTPQDWQAHTPRLIHVTPSHQYPLGALLSLPRRLDMIRHAAACGAWIIEDDYDSAFAYGGRPLAAMQGLVEDAPVIYAGTFSRMLFPALRIGYLVVPPSLAELFDSSVAELTWPGHAVEQAALAEFIARGKLATHVRRMKRLYGERRSALQGALERQLGGMLQGVGGAAGMHLNVLLDPALGVADTAVAAAAERLGVTLRPLSVYALPDARSPALNGFALGYAALPVDAIEAAVTKLRQAIEQARPAATARLRR